MNPIQQCVTQFGRFSLAIGCVLAIFAGAAFGQEVDFGMTLDVQQKDDAFVTQASFRLPLKMCQAWRFLIDYDSARNIPGVVESKSTRLADNKVRVERVLQDRILLFPIRMRTVMDFVELPNDGAVRGHSSRPSLRLNYRGQS